MRVDNVHCTLCIIVGGVVDFLNLIHSRVRVVPEVMTVGYVGIIALSTGQIPDMRRIITIDGEMVCVRRVKQA